MIQQALALYENKVHLDRVSSRIGHLVIAFFRNVGEGNTFSSPELLRYVASRELCAPDSPSRIMRQLRLEGHLDYEVVNRRQAKYVVTMI
jgi:hypothetical protein